MGQLAQLGGCAGWIQALQEMLVICLMELLGSMDLHYGMDNRLAKHLWVRVRGEAI